MEEFKFGEIRYAAISADGHKQMYGSTTSTNPQMELGLMQSFLELERAHRLRFVTIRPYAIGTLIVASPDVSIFRLVRCWISARIKVQANKKKGT